MSHSGDAAVGMMDQAYFTGRKELLDFFNDLLELNLTKIEQTATGAVACQLTEYIYPGSIPMSKVNWEAKSEYEFVQNYKLLQVAFKKHNIQRHVDVEKLCKAKYQDNLEFCQWMKAFFDQSGAFREDYDAMAVRSKGKGGSKATKILDSNASKFNSKPVPSGTRRTTTTAMSARPTRTTAPMTGGSRPTSSTNATSRSTTTAATTSTIRNGKENNTATKNHLTEAVLADAQLMKKNSDLTNKVHELETSLAEVETERDFYFEKLRDVEIMLQVHKETDGSDPDALVEKVFKILYATADQGLTVGDDGEILVVSDGDALEEDLLME